MAAGESKPRKAITLAEAFIEAHQGNWLNGDWKKLLEQARKAGIEVEDAGVSKGHGRLPDSENFNRERGASER
jgi:hypothetical protein